MNTVFIFMVLLVIVTGFRILEIQAATASTALKSHGAVLRCLSLGCIAALATGLSCMALILLLTGILPDAVHTVKRGLTSLAHGLGLTTAGEFASALALAVLLLGLVLAPPTYRVFRRTHPRLAD